MRVREILYIKGDKVVAVRPQSTIAEVIGILACERIGSVLVTSDDGTLMGIISERDITYGYCQYEGALPKKRAGELMTRSVVTCRPQHGIDDVMKLMNSHGVRHLPVVDDGELVGMVSARDVMKCRMALLETNIEAMKRAEQELLRAKEDAEIANRAKSDFLANMSHELRTPLNAILGFSGIVQNESFGPIGNPKYRGYITDIHESGRHLLALVDDLLDFSRIEARRHKLDEEQIDVPKVIRSCLTLVKERAQEGGVKIVSEVPEELPALFADKRNIKQILTNLLSNAVKFTSSGGGVTVRAWVHADDGYVFQVADTGIGIALEDIPKALSPFAQVDGSLNRKYEGAGLGLPLAKSLVELHGGSLDLQSQVGVGTTVTVRFPAERIVAPELDAAHSPAA
ncbi:MAG: ATP-binding protein [Alphaproteobacteria bacterium]|nr:CBS domain-containing protein [Pseudomonadota bacterium]